jgi:hypothetical protein
VVNPRVGVLLSTPPQAASEAAIKTNPINVKIMRSGLFCELILVFDSLRGFARVRV